MKKNYDLYVIIRCNVYWGSLTCLTQDTKDMLCNVLGLCFFVNLCLLFTYTASFCSFAFAILFDGSIFISICSDSRVHTMLVCNFPYAFII